MDMDVYRAALVLVSLLILVQSANCEEIFDPIVIVYTGRMPEFGAALAEIVEETGTRTLVAKTDSVLRGLISLPQVRCVVVATQNPSDFGFLSQFSSVLVDYFRDGGSLVGIGPCCSMRIEELATTVFPIMGNASGRGRPIEGVHGSRYVLAQPLASVTDQLPESFAITQNEFDYLRIDSAPVDPSSDLDETEVIYREEETGAPMVVILEGSEGGRTVSWPGCYVVDVERLPFYWGRLVEQEEFRRLLVGLLDWAMEGNSRYDERAPSAQMDLQAEAERLDEVMEDGEDLRRRSERGRLYTLLILWSIAIVFQGFLVVKFLLPGVREA
jgi:hypothetical protein